MTHAAVGITRREDGLTRQKSRTEIRDVEHKVSLASEKGFLNCHGTETKDGRQESANPDERRARSAQPDGLMAPSWQQTEGGIDRGRAWETVTSQEEEQEKTSRRRAREREGAHYVSVISRIQRVFSICSKAPLVRRPVVVRGRERRVAAEKDRRKTGEPEGERKNREKRGR